MEDLMEMHTSRFEPAREICHHCIDEEICYRNPALCGKVRAAEQKEGDKNDDPQTQ